MFCFQTSHVGKNLPKTLTGLWAILFSSPLLLSFFLFIASLSSLFFLSFFLPPSLSVFLSHSKKKQCQLNLDTPSLPPPHAELWWRFLLEHSTWSVLTAPRAAMFVLHYCAPSPHSASGSMRLSPGQPGTQPHSEGGWGDKQ